MRIVPYKSFGDVQLGYHEKDVVAQLGNPDQRVINDAGEIELRYEAIVVRLHSELGAVEVTSRPDSVRIEDAKVSRHDLPQWLHQMDAHACDSYGFVISEKFGVAVDTDTHNDGWISVFVKGRWGELIQDASIG